MDAQSLTSHDTADGQQTLTNWLALLVLLAPGIVWPPTNTVSANVGTAPAARRTHAVVTNNPPAQGLRRAWLQEIAR